MNATTPGPKGLATRQRLIESMLSLIQVQGYHGSGLNTVLEHASAPRGSLYFHFPGGKEELGVGAVALARAQFEGLIREGVGAGASPAAVVGSTIAVLAQMLEEADFATGCPVSVVTLEAAGESELLRVACDGAYQAWTTQVAGFLLAAGYDDQRARTLASTVISLVEGAMIVSRARRSTQPLQDASEALAMLLEPGPKRSSDR